MNVYSQNDITCYLWYFSVRMSQRYIHASVRSSRGWLSKHQSPKKKKCYPPTAAVVIIHEIHYAGGRFSCRYHYMILLVTIKHNIFIIPPNQAIPIDGFFEESLQQIDCSSTLFYQQQAKNKYPINNHDQQFHIILLTQRGNRGATVNKVL